jgi:transcriptional regulator with XRE-family HTH domain
MEDEETKERLTTASTKERTIQDVGIRLREVRMALGYSQQYFSALLNTSAGFISEIEGNKKSPGIQLLYSLWRKFNININWLLTGKGTMFNSHSRSEHTSPSQEPQRSDMEQDLSIHQQIVALQQENERLQQKVRELQSQVALLSELIIKIKKS